MAKISGILTDGAGQIINDCTIELYAKKTTNKVLTQTQTFQVSENGKYSMNVLPCEYEVSLIINGFPKKRLGKINVYSDSVDGTLNDYLINPEESDLTPEFLKQIFDARNEAIKSAIDSYTSAKKSADSANHANTSETNAKSSADAAKASADEAATSSQLASKSAITATDAASVATTSSDTAKIYADNANNLAKEANQSAINSANSAKSANTSEVNAKSSEVAAKNSADNAKNWASTVDNSNFIKKTGDEKQRIDGQLDVNKLTENGKSVITDLTDVNNKINSINTNLNILNNRAYVVESYHYGTEWYRVYSDGYIEQSGALIVKTPSANEVCGTLINLLKPMGTQNYGVSIDKIHSGAWGITEFAYGELYQSAFWLASYSNVIDEGWIRWTVRGY